MERRRQSLFFFCFRSIRRFRLLRHVWIFKRAGGDHLASLHCETLLRHRQPLCLQSDIFFRPLVCLVKPFGKKSDLCKKELLQSKGTYRVLLDGHFLKYKMCQSNQRKNFVLFILVSLFFIKGLRRQCTQCWDVIKA